MVVKRAGGAAAAGSQFESSVILYGSQTSMAVFSFFFAFESSVILYGSQTRTIRALSEMIV